MSHAPRVDVYMNSRGVRACVLEIILVARWYTLRDARDLILTSVIFFFGEKRPTRGEFCGVCENGD